MGEKDNIPYVKTSGQTTNQYFPLVLAQTAQMMNIKPIVYYLGLGLKILKNEFVDAVALDDLALE
jgi:predicted peroxiredoxin